jgi:protein-tyrosine-phosphatase
MEEKHKRHVKKTQFLQNSISYNLLASHNANISFYSGVVNKSNTTFNKAEQRLMEKGLKYNHHKPTSWIKRLASEADTAINMIKSDEQN